jgi:hypothetical protein
MLNPAIESAIIEQLLLLDDDRKAEVLNFILSLTARSKPEAFPAKTAKEIDPMRYSGTVSWPVDGLAYQEKLRGEWE